MNTHGGNIWYAAKRYNLLPENILDFSASINPFAPVEKIKNIVSDNIKNIYFYPDPEYTSLKECIASYLDVPTESILPGNGSTELIYLIAQALHLKNALIVIPTFSEYENAVKLTGGNAVFINTYPENDFKIIAEEVITHNVRALFICNPNNPTGTLFQKDELLEIIRICKRQGTIVIIDEAFIEFVEDYEKLSLARESVKTDNLIVIRSLTKIFGIPGLRIGYTVADPDTINILNIYQKPWTVNCFAETAALKLIKAANLIRDSIRLIGEQRIYLLHELRKIDGLTVFDSCANFILCHIDTEDLDSNELCDLMGQRGILLRDCSNIRGLNNRYFRIAVKKCRDNQRLITELGSLFNNVS